MSTTINNKTWLWVVSRVNGKEFTKYKIKRLLVIDSISDGEGVVRLYLRGDIELP